MDASKLINIFDINKDGFVERSEFLQSLTFKNQNISQINFKNTPIPNFSLSVAEKNDPIKNENLKNNALNKLQKLLYTKQFNIIFTKFFGKFDGIHSFAITRQEFIDFLSFIPKNDNSKENLELSKAEINCLCQEADNNRKNQIKLDDFLNFVKGLTFDQKKQDEMDKINNFLSEELKNDAFIDIKHEKNRKNDDRIEKKEGKLEKIEKMIEKSMIVIPNADLMQKTTENQEEIEKNQENQEEIEKNKKILKDFQKDSKDYQIFLEEKVKTVSNKLKESTDDLKKIKPTKTDFFSNEGRYYITIFVNPITCLKKYVFNYQNFIFIVFKNLLC